MVKALLDLLDRDHTIASPHYNRWLFPPCALAIHLCIGMAYGFSVFWLPLSQSLGITAPIPCPKDMTFWQSIFTATCDWKISSLGWIYSLFFVFLGSAAALFGKWSVHVGPRKAGFISALLWSGGFVVSAVGIHFHQLWLLWLGSGVIGGIGLGLGYISPVTALIKWFPDKRGLATGLAIMGFGGGAMIGAPLSDLLMNFYATSTSVGVTETFLTLAVIYFIFMTAGAFGYRVPPHDFVPKGYRRPKNSDFAITDKEVHVSVVWKTPQFWLLWWVLCLNVSAGIGIIGMASPMLQEVFAGRLIGLDLSFDELSSEQKVVIASMAAGFTALLSLFNIIGRVFWASLSDYIGRKVTYSIFFAFGFVLYAIAPWSAHVSSIFLFVVAFSLILSMYGGGFAAIPAYVADLFGTQMVGAIHGRLLTAWSVAGILGPLLVNYLREYQLAQGVSRSLAYDVTIYTLAGFLLIGLICNLLIRPVHPKYHMTDEQLAEEQAAIKNRQPTNQVITQQPRHPVFIVFVWLFVIIPLLWATYITVEKTILLFRFS